MKNTKIICRKLISKHKTMVIMPARADTSECSLMSARQLYTRVQTQLDCNAAFVPFANRIYLLCCPVVYSYNFCMPLLMSIFVIPGLHIQITSFPTINWAASWVRTFQSLSLPSSFFFIRCTLPFHNEWTSPARMKACNVRPTGAPFPFPWMFPIHPFVRISPFYSSTVRWWSILMEQTLHKNVTRHARAYVFPKQIAMSSKQAEQISFSIEESPAFPFLHFHLFLCTSRVATGFVLDQPGRFFRQWASCRSAPKTSRHWPLFCSLYPYNFFGGGWTVQACVFGTSLFPPLLDIPLSHFQKDAETLLL